MSYDSIHIYIYTLWSIPIFSPYSPPHFPHIFPTFSPRLPDHLAPISPPSIGSKKRLTLSWSISGAAQTASTNDGCEMRDMRVGIAMWWTRFRQLVEGLNMVISWGFIGMSTELFVCLKRVKIQIGRITRLTGWGETVFSRHFLHWSCYWVEFSISVLALWNSKRCVCVSPS